MKYFKILILLSLTVAFSACSTFTKQQNISSKYPNVKTELYFGQNSPNGKLSKKQWLGFVNNTIAKEFPDGFTIYDAWGQWMYSPGKISREKMKIVIILHKNSLEDDRKINKIIGAYKIRFNQLSVLKSSSPVKYSF